MKSPAKRTIDYPEKTSGSEIAAQVRARANKMTPAQRDYYYRRGMALINQEDAVLSPPRRRNAIADES